MAVTAGMSDVRILVVGADLLARAGLAALLSGQPGLSVVGQVSGGDGLANDVDVYRPDVLVWDLGWDSDAVEQLAEWRNTGTPVVALVGQASHASQVWAAGARGLARRDSDTAVLASLVRAVASGVAALDPVFSDSLASVGERGASVGGDLTPRELEVLPLLAEGLPNKAIATRLGISEHTVKFHINAIMGKLSAQSRTEAVARAIRLGLIPL